MGTPGLGGGSRETTGGNIDTAPVGLPHPSPNTPATPRQIPPSGWSTRHQDLDELILSLNRSLRGWANYFRHGVSKAVFNAVDYHAWGRLMRWIRAKYAGKRSRLGMNELRHRFCDQGWRFAYKGVVFTGASSVAITRYRYRGSNILTPWTPKPTAVTNG